MLRTLMVAMFMSLATHASAGDIFYDDKITIKDLQNIRVNLKLTDGATGACWTNIKEVREYAEEKLRMKGVTVTSDVVMDVRVKAYYLTINVNARRLTANNSGPCVHSIGANLYSWVRANGLKHIGYLARLDKVNGINDNANRSVLLMVEEFFAAFPK